MPNRLGSLVSAATLAVAVSGAALSAHAAVFAQFLPVTNASDYSWVNNGSGGHFFSINDTSDTSAQGVSTAFNFLEPAYAVLGMLPATFTIDATAASGNPADFNSGSGTWAQRGLDGSFSFTYSGADTTIGGFHLVNGENLLSGVFTDAWIQGAGGTGSANVSFGNGGAATYASDIFDFSHEVAGSEEFAFNLLGANPNFNAATGQALGTFNANGGGNFDAITGVVPEPGAWALMILGFGGAGAMLRRRRTRGAALA
jgi:hypothetical protein